MCDGCRPDQWMEWGNVVERWVARKLALCWLSSNFQSCKLFWMRPSALPLGCHTPSLLTGSRFSVPGELTEIAVPGVISKAEAVVCPDSRCTWVRAGLPHARRPALAVPSPVGQRITERSHFFSSSFLCWTPPVRLCVPAQPVRAAFEAVFPEHLESLVPRSRRDVCARGRENKVREACCVPAAWNRRSSAGLDTMQSDECNFKGGVALPLQSGHGSSHNRARVS